MKTFYSFLFCCLALCGRSYAQNDLELRAVYPLDYATPGTWPFGTALFFHATSGSAIYYKIGWQLDGGPVQSWTSPSQDPYFYIPGNNLRRISDGSFKVTFTTPGIHQLKVWAKLTTPSDPNPVNDTIIKNVKVFAYLPQKNVVMETYKHQNCPPCYPAANFIHAQMEPKPDYSIVNCYTTIATEALFNKVADTVNTVYQLAHPEALYDRFMFPFNTKIYSDFIGGVALDTAERRYYLEPVEIGLPMVSVDNNLHKLKVKVSARIFDTLKGEYRFNVFVTEDSVKGYQANAPNPSNYYHMKVLRSMMGGAWGQAGSIPATTLLPGQEFYYEFEIALPYGFGITEWNQSKMHITGLLQKYNAQDIYDRRILNSKEMTLPKALGISSEQFDAIALSIYPNPFTDELTITSTSLNGSVSVTDITGRMIWTEEVKGQNELHVSTAQWAQGMYLLTYRDVAGMHTVRKIRK